MSNLELATKIVNMLGCPERDYVIEDILDRGHKINVDGTITLYHATTKDKAKQILKDGFFKTAEGVPDAYGVYFSTSPEVAEEYGDETLVKARVNVCDVNPDDFFPATNRMDFQVETKGGIYKPVEVGYEVEELMNIEEKIVNAERCQIVKDITKDLLEEECQTEGDKCKIAKEIADKVVKKECSVYTVNWDTTKTDIPIFDMSIVHADDPKKHYNCELKWLSLDEFLDWQCKTKNTTKEEFLGWVGDDTVNSIIEGIKKGNPFNAFVLEFDEEGKLEDFQEGRHRIIAMKRLGIERVPVYFCKRIY